MICSLAPEMELVLIFIMAIKVGTENWSNYFNEASGNVITHKFRSFFFFHLHCFFFLGTRNTSIYLLSFGQLLNSLGISC